MVLGNKTFYLIVALLVAMLVSALALLTGTAQSQEEPAQQEKNSAQSQDRTSGERAPDNRQNRRILREARAALNVAASGDLMGEMLVEEPDDAGETIFVVEVRDCTVEPGAASITVEDAEGDLGVLSDEINDVDIADTPERVEVRSTGDGDVAFIAGEDFDLTGEFTVVSSAGIECGEEMSTPEMSTPDTTMPGTTAPDTTVPPDTTTPETTMEPEPQDEEKGPLAGGAAFGEDVLVPGDPVDNDGDGEQDTFNGEPIVGLDQITIETENCELTTEGEDLTITLDDQGVPFRLRDGQNVDIRQEGDTIIADGRDNVDGVDNPTRIIIQIPVDPENADFSEVPNDAFPIVSSTGIDGEGCRAVNDADETTDLDTTPDRDTTDDVDTGDDDLPNTGGGPADTRTALLFVVSGFALLALRIATSRRRA